VLNYHVITREINLVPLDSVKPYQRLNSPALRGFIAQRPVE
jgi:hypothetical protein